MIGDAAHIFPAEDGLFEETFSTDNTYRVHGLNITIHQDYSASLGVAASVWDSALHLCQFFENESLDLSGTRIIELGGGTGLVGIVAARLGAHVTITDLPSAVSQIERNIAANTPFSGWPSDGPSVSALAWGLDHSRFSSSWDFVLGADIVYLPETFPLLLDTLVHLCRDGAVVYLASTMRREHGAQDFYDHMLPQMFSVELVQRDPENNINIYKATLR
ncbi:protein-lysine methyltransferase METTL21B-like isoform X1 [Sinocyclocheilus grahami]|uniref:EEF1A lysine methyltransferase 3 n=1 Tax=Sinocyclocheilus grahami TaxID=75366 RepID=A0A672LQT0_SINGR|nr:PREDICTED: protein-lysine methyltransferase METTL21B isoform X1 [Sinocyclocheilus grahami]XP_016109235.1 PREDICTED: protein-lysine methyltransferase METTL21B-like isoform X1 [Sinocyclocheilus grahami]